MILNKLKLKNFRSYDEALFEPCPGITVLAGNNAQGKTNLLEAIYFMSTGRAHRTNKDNELIKHECDFARVEITAAKKSDQIEITAVIPKNDKKRIKIDGTPITRSGELLGNVLSVLFSPEDLRIVKDGPEVRRRFIDMELSQLRPGYYYELQKYLRALKHRNALLKQDNVSDDLFLPFNEQLGKSGFNIQLMRRDFIKSIAKIAGEIYYKVAGNGETLQVEYEPNIEDYSSEEALIKAFNRALSHDKLRRTTSIGPHRDDIRLLINDTDARAYASQGQQRTISLSLKLSELSIMKEISGEQPILMLDDVMSELDPSRRRMLLSALEGVQTIITCTDVSDLAGANVGKTYLVNASTLKEA